MKYIYLSDFHLVQNALEMLNFVQVTQCDIVKFQHILNDSKIYGVKFNIRAIKTIYCSYSDEQFCI